MLGKNGSIRLKYYMRYIIYIKAYVNFLPSYVTLHLEFGNYLSTIVEKHVSKEQGKSFNIINWF